MTSARTIVIDGLVCRFGAIRALDGITLSIDEATLHGLVGPNGSGKTTLLRAIAGAIAPLEGRVLVEGAQPHLTPAAALARVMAVLPQHPVAPLGVTVREAVSWGRIPHLGRLAGAGARDLRAIDRALEAAGVSDLAGRPVQTLSGGERQRVLIARAIAQEPRILLLDEPTAHLDVAHQAEVMEVVRRLARGGLTVVAALHDLTLVADYCDRVTLLASGRLRASGPPAAVLTDDAIRDTYGAAAAVTAGRTGTIARPS
jgi:iron complex transport system ATP-binding protein